MLIVYGAKMTAPNGAITTVEHMREVLGRGVRTLYLAPAYSERCGMLKFSILDPALSKERDYWIIGKAHDETRGYDFPTGVVVLAPRGGWWWFDNYWLAYVTQLRHKLELEKGK